MKEYVEKLYTKLHEAMEKPVTLGGAEEVGLYAKTISRLEKLDCRADEPDAAAFDRETAIHWAEHMQNADGSTGPHWTMDQTSAVADARGIGRGDEHDVLRLLRRRRGLRREPPGVLRSPGRGVSDGQGRPRSGGKAVRVL